MLKKDEEWQSVSDFVTYIFALNANVSITWSVIAVDRCNFGRPEGQQHKKKTDSIDAKLLSTISNEAIITFSMSYYSRECDLLQKFQPRPPAMGRHYCVSLHFSVMYTQSGLLIKL